MYNFDEKRKICKTYKVKVKTKSNHSYCIMGL